MGVMCCGYWSPGTGAFVFGAPSMTVSTAVFYCYAVCAAFVDGDTLPDIVYVLQSPFYLTRDNLC